MKATPIRSLRVGALAPLGPRQVQSGIAKTEVISAVALTAAGLDGDMQGDRERHGGPEKAIHHYPFEHYAAWSRDLGADPMLATPGAFGENISTLGLTEENIAIGDLFELGSAIVEVSQGRQPCWRLNERFGRKTMARAVQATGRTGWYYRVLRPGIVAPADHLTLVDRISPEWTIGRIWRAFYVDTLNRSELVGISALDHLSENWRTLAARRLDSGAVEDWDRRLMGG
ncbi:MOSC domain-containing protein [Rhizobium metallidurans]|uniref:MOSC domain-containing protein YiiM n=1 Tax=Rhizobium metallidurans TaxID=1265931 RepID=A0A7W6CS19_9HYPH|nr:MOSC domain-containing protein [Rhizobium metallidurans]MBB3966105.1 MOSC domain-containing protein YiiM [Rhizobium metallidurans]